MAGNVNAIEALPYLAKMAAVLVCLAQIACAPVQPFMASPTTTVKLPVPLDTRSTTAEWFIADQSDVRQAEIDEVLWLRLGREIRQEEAYLEFLNPQGQSSGIAGEHGVQGMTGMGYGSNAWLVVRFDTAKTDPLADLDIPRGSLQVLRAANRVVIEGHTDSVGSVESNKRLGERRANIVARWLIAHGVQANTIETIGVGEGAPIADNKTAEGRRLNRRSVVRVESDRSS